MATTGAKTAAVAQQLERRIYIIRGQKVMLDRDLAELYQVPTKRVNEQVRRNLGRFPKDFMFTLRKAEITNLKSQIATSSWGGSRKAPLAFTEHGVAMLSAVLNSQRAVKMSILVIRAFVKLREVMAKDKEFALRLRRVEAVQDLQGNILDSLEEEIREIKILPDGPKRKIGFQRVE
jgi:hypothetical protein